MIGRRTEPLVESEPAEPKGFDDYDLRLGDIMRGERATMGKSLLDVQRELKIKATYISAIENSDPSAFETPGFIAGYVRSYARYLNLDPEWAYRKFCRESNFEVAHGMSQAASGKAKRSADARNPAPRRDPFEQPGAPFVPRGESVLSRIEPGALGSMLVLLGLIGFIGYGGWTVLREVQRVQFTPVDQAPGISDDIAVLSDAPGTEGSVEGNVALTALPEVGGPQGLDRLYRPQALEVPILAAPRDGPIATLDPGSVATVLQDGVPDSGPSRRVLAGVAAPDATPATTTPEAEAPPVQVVANDAPEVLLFAVRPAWVRVSGPDGTVLFEKILEPGERYVLPKTEEAPLLRTGNAGSVYFAVNGETYGPAGDGPSVVKNVALAAADLKDRFNVADPASDRDLAKVVAEADILRPAE